MMVQDDQRQDPVYQATVPILNQLAAATWERKLPFPLLRNLWNAVVAMEREEKLVTWRQVKDPCGALVMVLRMVRGCMKLRCLSRDWHQQESQCVAAR